MHPTSFYLSLKSIELDRKSQLNGWTASCRRKSGDAESIIVDFKKEGVLKIAHQQYGEKF